MGDSDNFRSDLSISDGSRSNDDATEATEQRGSGSLPPGLQYSFQSLSLQPQPVPPQFHPSTLNPQFVPEATESTTLPSVSRPESRHSNDDAAEATEQRGSGSLPPGLQLSFQSLSLQPQPVPPQFHPSTLNPQFVPEVTESATLSSNQPSVSSPLEHVPQADSIQSGSAHHREHGSRSSMRNNVFDATVGIVRAGTCSGVRPSYEFQFRELENTFWRYKRHAQTLNFRRDVPRSMELMMRRLRMRNYENCEQNPNCRHKHDRSNAEDMQGASAGSVSLSVRQNRQGVDWRNSISQNLPSSCMNDQTSEALRFANDDFQQILERTDGVCRSNSFSENQPQIFDNILCNCVRCESGHFPKWQSFIRIRHARRRRQMEAMKKNLTGG